jgi:hypothetical protein
MGRRSHRKIKQRKRMILPPPSRPLSHDKIKLEPIPDYRSLWLPLHERALQEQDNILHWEMDLHKRIQERLNHI